MLYESLKLFPNLNLLSMFLFFRLLENDTFLNPETFSSICHNLNIGTCCQTCFKTFEMPVVYCDYWIILCSLHSTEPENASCGLLHSERLTR